MLDQAMAGRAGEAEVDDLINDFIAETREGLEVLDSELVRFEQHPDDPALLDAIFRLIHTIKGACGFLGLNRLQTVAHAAENVLGAFRDGDLKVSVTAVSAILDTVDLIRSLIDALAATGAEPAGDDGVLIDRLEAVLTAAPTAEAEDAPATEAAGPVHARALIDELGGDACLDAACEMVVMRHRADTFDGLDPDVIQGALRDGFIAAARGSGGPEDFQARVAAAAPDLAAPETLIHIQRAVAAALGTLEIPAAPIEALMARVQPQAAAVETAPAPRVEPSPQPAPAAAPTSQDVEAAQAPQTIRVSVDALEHLMTVASELVLIRNQLIQTLRQEPESPFAAPLNRLNQVTSELQEGVMTTRMQPISGAWAKLPRLVRDLAQDLGKKIELSMVGQETELDRQVLEMIKDPLTHMIRNAADHGLETPEQRKAAGKSETGRINLVARHEGGAIVIEIGDDGRGLSASKIRAKAVASGLVSAAQGEAMSDAEARQLIFAPGFSTAAEVTAVSGRGVGMDVVRTNIEKIGGAIELASVEGQGSRFTIRIPLTLTIVSALIVECCGERFAMPQSSVLELVSASDASGRQIEYIDGSAVLRLRDRLLPLVSLQALLGLDIDQAAPGETCIVVAKVGAFSFGVIVDRVFDTEEIVVKPVATVLRQVKLYSGATILGDGSVIMIIDFKGVSMETGAGQAAADAVYEDDIARAAAEEEKTAVLVFRAEGDALKVAPLASVARIEEIAASQLERVDGRTVIQYRGKLMPVVSSGPGEARPWDGDSQRPLLVFARGEQSVGLLVSEIVDVVESSLETELGSSGAGALGSLIIAGSGAELIDVGYYWNLATGQKPPAAPISLADHGRPAGAVAAPAAPLKRLLIIDQSPFCQMLLRPLLTTAGYDVTVATGAKAAADLYAAGETFHLIMIDSAQAGEPAQELARALALATGWHATPLMGVGMQSLQPLGAGAFATGLLGAVSQNLSETLSELGAAA